MNEIYMMVVGKKFRWFYIGYGMDGRVGKPSSVSFNYKVVHDREVQKGDVIGFYHTHPEFINTYSQTDRQTMEAWTECFGRPLLCAIEGTNGYHAWWFGNGRFYSRRGIKIGRWFIGLL